MLMYDILLRKRNGLALSKAEIDFFVEGAVSGRIPDYQIAAMLMAIAIRGMEGDEVRDLTLSMMASGEVADLSGIPGIKVDKHSTGGVGDKTSMMATPIAAACGIPVAKMTGKGMGHACGTMDKLDAIPGMRTAIEPAEFIENVKAVGISIVGQTGGFVPADKIFYALRDVTATIDSMPLIASSIMSKKLAAGADRILLDVKTGSGSFVGGLEHARELARVMVGIGAGAGRRTHAIITDMDKPLGTHIGNGLETIEALEVLKGRGGEELTDFAVYVAARMLELADEGPFEDCLARARAKLDDGSALEKFRAMVVRQGGDPRALDDYSLLSSPKTVKEVRAPETGYIGAIDTRRVGMAALALGAGRQTKEAPIDYAAGIVMEKTRGDFVAAGDVVATLHTNRGTEEIGVAERAFTGALRFTEEKPEEIPLVYDFIKNGTKK
ncbi:MAG: thymidine phosphorylase [Clostridiales Family XIII bacterium]|jgi:pyrimidine-nucleoside phosphorylase|nr:thymidine phosphorylase [Clostridiales Family XIII bacterium]